MRHSGRHENRHRDGDEAEKDHRAQVLRHPCREQEEHGHQPREDNTYPRRDLRRKAVHVPVVRRQVRPVLARVFGGGVPAHERLHVAAEQLAEGNQLFHFGKGGVRLPAGNRLPRDFHFLRQTFLGDAVLLPIEYDVASETHIFSPWK